MKRDKLTFLIAELILIVLAAFFIHKIFQEDVAQKRVAVILQNSGDTRWEGVINGLKQSAKTNNLRSPYAFVISSTVTMFILNAPIIYPDLDAIAILRRHASARFITQRY